MYFSKEFGQNELEFQTGIYFDVWALPIQIAWWKSIKHPLTTRRLRSARIVDIQIFCVHFSFSWWKWGE